MCFYLEVSNFILAYFTVNFSESRDRELVFI
jgi:hypothetical protein